MKFSPVISPRFGFRSHTHHHIDAVAIDRMPETTEKLEQLSKKLSKEKPKAKDSGPLGIQWWKQFLNKNLAKIDRANDLKDLVNPVPQKHYIDLEHRGNHREPLSLEQRSWEDIQREFSPQMLEFYQQEWKKNPLTPDTISKEAPNLMTSIGEAYSQVVEHLKKIVQGFQAFDGNKMDPILQKSLLDQLRVYAGDLAHFVADLFVPLHATEFFDWPLSGPSDKMIHIFLEGDILKESDPLYTKIVQDANRRRKVLPHVTKATIQQDILNIAQNSFKMIFKMVDIQKQVLQDPGNLKSADNYEAILAERLKHEILVPQIKAAQETLGGILQSAWEEAYEGVLPPYSSQ